MTLIQDCSTSHVLILTLIFVKILSSWLLRLSVAWHTWPCPCFSVVPEATHEASRGLFELTRRLSRVRDGDEGVAGRNGREKCFPNERLLICPAACGQNKDFFTHLPPPPNIQLLATRLAENESISPTFNWLKLPCQAWSEPQKRIDPFVRQPKLYRLDSLR